MSETWDSLKRANIQLTEIKEGLEDAEGADNAKKKLLSLEKYKAIQGQEGQRS